VSDPIPASSIKLTEQIKRDTMTLCRNVKVFSQEAEVEDEHLSGSQKRLRRHLESIRPSIYLRPLFLVRYTVYKRVAFA
jgi:hypothetical protein